MSFAALKAHDEIEGSGMGLSVVKKLVESGGTVRVTSSLGKGATFYFTWPSTILPEDHARASGCPTSAGS